MDWPALSQMLKPFLETTDILCVYTASLGKVIPLIHALEQSLEIPVAPGSSLLPRTRALVGAVGRHAEVTPYCLQRLSSPHALPV